MRIRRILVLFIIIFTSASIAIAQIYTSPNYTLKEARIVISGGKANSTNYSFYNVTIGNPFGGKAGSANYSLDASPIDAPPNNSPIITGILPPDGSTDYTEDNVNFSVTAEPQDNNSLVYQFSLYDLQIGDWDVIRSWLNDPSFNWPTSGVTPGIQSIKVEVSNNTGGGMAQYVELYLFRKPLAPPIQ